MKRVVLSLVLFLTVSLVGVLFVSPYRVTYPFPALHEVVTQASDGRPLRLALWRNDSSPNGSRRGAVLFVHGLTKQGPEEPVYSVFCDALARQDLVVAAPWLRGYDSDKALDVGQSFVPSRWDPLPDIAATFAFLQKDPGVDPKRIFVVGHSLGGGYALMFGLQQPEVAGIVSFSRLDMESRLRSRPGYFNNFRLGLAKTFRLDEPPSVKAFQDFADSQIFAFEIVRERLASADHPPILFAIGGQERLSDRQWLSAYSAEASGLTEYYEFPGATHTLNFRGLRGIWVYEPHRIDEVASALARWLRGQSLTGSSD
jgi:dienelactone hydrolase